MPHDTHDTHNHGERKDNAVSSAVRTVWWEAYELWDQVLYCVGDVYDRLRGPSTSDRRQTAAHDRRHKDRRYSV